MVAAIENSSALATEQPHPDKLAHAARQFEAILLNQLLGSLQHAFCSLGEEKKTAGSDQYQFLGMQALAAGVASKGGLGIADMIIRNLTSRHISAASSITAKKPL